MVGSSRSVRTACATVSCASASISSRFAPKFDAGPSSPATVSTAIPWRSSKSAEFVGAEEITLHEGRVLALVLFGEFGRVRRRLDEFGELPNARFEVRGALDEVLDDGDESHHGDENGRVGSRNASEFPNRRVPFVGVDDVRQRSAETERRVERVVGEGQLANVASLDRHPSTEVTLRDAPFCDGDLFRREVQQGHVVSALGQPNRIPSRGPAGVEDVPGFGKVSFEIVDGVLEFEGVFERFAETLPLILAEPVVVVRGVDSVPRVVRHSRCRLSELI